MRRALKRQLYLLALLIALRLKDQALQRDVVLATPASEVMPLSFTPQIAVVFILVLFLGCCIGWRFCRELLMSEMNPLNSIQ